MDPREIGEMVVDAIRQNHGHILSHGEFRDEVAEVCQELLDAFPVGQEVDEDRLAFQAMIRKQTDDARAAIDRMDDSESSTVE